MVTKTREQIRCYIGLGANLNNPESQIKAAFSQLHTNAHIQLLKTSSLYTSRAIGPPQPSYINAVALISTHLEPLLLLNELQQMEQTQGRVREEHWGPRTLDLDLLLYGNEVIQNARLTVPHPEIKNRAFVILPLQEIAADLQLPDRTPISLLAKNFNHQDESPLLLP